MKAIKYFSCIFLFVVSCRIFSQDQKIFVFDPAGLSNSFQYSFKKISNDKILIADSINNKINDCDALFLFLGNQYVLNQTEGNLLINYLQNQKPIYLYAKLFYQQTNEVTFWNFIGFEDYVEIPLYVLVDSVVGINTTFSSGVIIDTTFWSPQMPAAQGNIFPLLKGFGSPMEIDVAYISGVASINVIIDQYHQIYHPEFLRRAIEHFNLNLRTVNIHFFPPVDTARIFGGCTGPDLVTHNLVSTPTRDSITIEPGPNSYFFYYDSLGNQILVDKYFFIVEDSLNQYDYELWFHPKSWPPFDPIVIPFDSVFYFHQNSFEIQLIVKQNGNPIDSLSQLFRADWGLGVETESQIPNTFFLSQNYPNPFNPSTKIKFQIPDQSALSGRNDNRLVSLKVYDVLGNEIATLVNEVKQSGTYEVEFDASSGIRNLPAGRQGLVSGIYFYQLKAGSYIETKKMVLIK